MSNPPSVVTEEMLAAAMKRAVSLGVFPKHGDPDSYLKNWGSMRSILMAALDCENTTATK